MRQNALASLHKAVHKVRNGIYLEQFGQGKPLPRHLIPIVGINELIIIDAIGSVPLHPLDRRVAAV